MSLVSATSEVERFPVALFIADIHLSLRPPVWRSAEPDWLEAMSRYLSELRKLQHNLISHSPIYDVPIFCAGDIFDKWFGAHHSSELVNFALREIPKMYAIPGQHDLPLHRYEDIKKSAFWTLVESDKIKLLQPDEISTFFYNEDNRLFVYSYPFGFDIEKPEKIGVNNQGLNVCIAHQYVHMPGHSYEGAPSSANIQNIKNLCCYDIAVFGDNHKGFDCVVGNTKVWNCGSFMRRHSNEVDYAPRVGILYSDGNIVSHYLDTSHDKYLDIVSDIIDEKNELDISEFVKGLEKLGDSALDFTQAIKEFVAKNEVDNNVKQILLSLVE